MPGPSELSPRTFGNEDRLPRVPLPTLEQSCALFLEWCAPLLDADELERTRAATAGFTTYAAPLQRALEAYDAAPGTHSWLDAFWDQRYLGRRDRIALSANFFFLFRESEETQVDRAAALVMGALAHKRRVDAETLPPATQRGEPLSMEQHKHLFSSCRVPGRVQDTVRTPYSPERPGPSTARHVLVLHRGRGFRVDVLGADGHPHALAEVVDALRAVLSSAPGGDPWPGPLTTKARAAWAADRESLLAHPGNAAALEVVETALLCVCLEDDDPVDAQDACDRLLAGDSTCRWFDTSVSLVVFPDGTAGYNGEHCRLDGTTVISMLDAVLESSGAEHVHAAGAVGQGRVAVAPVAFTLDDEQQARVRAAAEDFAAYAASTATRTVSLDFSSERAKACGVSPDAFAQLTFQLAQERAKGRLGATYESIATRSFHHGRTEAMRVVTPEVVAFVAAVEDPAASDDVRRDAARSAAQAHVARAKDCQAGRAPEQHLWELQMIHGRRGSELGVEEEPALFGSPGWTVMRADYLSTSAVPSGNVRHWGFGATSENCIGVAYALLPDRFDLYLTTPRSVGAAMDRFADALPGVVAELEALLGAEE